MLTFSWKITNTRVTSVSTRSSRITKNCSRHNRREFLWFRPLVKIGLCEVQTTFGTVKYQIKAKKSISHHAQQTALLLQGTHAAQEAGHHGDASSHEQQVGGWQRWEGQGERGELCLREGEPHSHSEQATAPELQHNRPGTSRVTMQDWDYSQGYWPDSGWSTLILTQKTRLKTNIKYLTQHKHLPDTVILWQEERGHSVTQYQHPAEISARYIDIVVQIFGQRRLGFGVWVTVLSPHLLLTLNRKLNCWQEGSSLPSPADLTIPLKAFPMITTDLWLTVLSHIFNGL